MTNRARAYLQIHTAVLLFGFTGIFGDLISLEKPVLVWYRFAFTVISLLVLPGIIRKALALDRKILLQLFGIGGLVATHWIFFFLSIHWTNVSVALSCFATTTLFTSFLEPLILRKKLLWYEVAIGLLVIPGVALVAGSNGFGITGIIFALIAAFLAALFSTLNKALVDKVEPMTMTFAELTGGWITNTIWAVIYILIFPTVKILPEGYDWLWICLLAFACTSFAYVISLKALKELTTFAVNLTVNLEPLYSIILAALILGEHKVLGWQFYLGAGTIFLAVFFHPLLHKWMEGVSFRTTAKGSK